jgi:hypothetical protein
VLHYTNTWYGKYVPISSTHSFDNTGAKQVFSRPQPLIRAKFDLCRYQVLNIINPDTLELDLEKYQKYSPLFLSTTFAVSYGLSFASITATLMHAFLYYRKQIWTQARRSLSEQPDIHARLMSRYPEVPEWWYAIVFITMFVFGVVSIEVYKTEFPVWAFVVALVIGPSFFFPSLFKLLKLPYSLLLYHPDRHDPGHH